MLLFASYSVPPWLSKKFDNDAGKLRNRISLLINESLSSRSLRRTCAGAPMRSWQRFVLSSTKLHHLLLAVGNACLLIRYDEAGVKRTPVCDKK